MTVYSIYRKYSLTQKQLTEWVNMALMMVPPVPSLDGFGKSSFHMSLISVSIILNYKVGLTPYVSGGLLS